ncbi:MAG: hypothetical protein J5685_07130 [Clostridiales bacterium]|nr:hypothetical protein [Clostridiales bacterium]
MRKSFLAAVLPVLMLFMTSCHVSFHFPPETSSGSGSIPEQLTAEDFVLHNPYGLEYIMISENGEDVPYYVISTDYDGNVLLLRKEVLPEPMPYSYEEAIYNTGVTYYPGSAVDQYLSDEFPGRLSDGLSADLAVSDVPVYTIDSVRGAGDMQIETIPRSIFVLSGSEVGLNVYHQIRDGETVDNIEEINAEELNWTRTSYFLEDDVRVFVNSNESYGGEGVSECHYIRPAITIPSGMNVIEDNGVYRLECER